MAGERRRNIFVYDDFERRRRNFEFVYKFTDGNNVIISSLFKYTV